MKLFLFILIILSCRGVLPGAQIVVEEEIVQPDIKRVLFVGSYHAEQASGRKVLSAINLQFEKAGYHTDVRAVYLDAKRVSSMEARRSLLETHLREIPGDLDLIIVSDEEANEVFFTLDMPLVRETPVVFCGVVKHDPLPGFEHVTGVVSDIDYGEVFLLGRKLFPEARRAYVFSDMSGAGRVHNRLAREQLARCAGDFPIYYENDTVMEVKDVIRQFEEIYPISFVILTTWQQGVQGTYLDPDIYYSMYANACPVPIFSATDVGLGRGIFGGKISFSNQQGVQAGQLAVRILNGEEAGAIPVDTVRSVPVFDDFELRRWRLDYSELPPDSMVLNKGESFWKMYESYILLALGCFAVLLFLLVFLFYYHLRYRKMLKRSVYLEKAAQQMADILKKKTEILSNTLSSMSEGILVVDEQLRIMEINRTSIEGLGCGEHVINKPLRDICELGRDRDGNGLEGLVRASMRDRVRKDLALDTVLIPCGAPVQKVAGSISPLINTSGDVRGAVIMFRDITREWKQRKFLSISINALQAYSWFYDKETGKLDFGEGFVDDKTLKEELNTFEKFVKRIHPDDLGAVEEMMTRSVQEGNKEFTISFRFDNRNEGAYNWWECRGIVETIELGNGQSGKFVYGMCIDIGRHKLAEERLEQALRKAEESDKLKSAFVANISHEIRTPLNSIVGFTNLLVDDGYSYEEKIMFKDAISNNSHDLLRLLDDVLDLSRLEAGMETVNVGVCDMCFLVRSMLDIGHLNVSKGVEMIDEGPVGELLVLTDEVKLTKVFLNLIGNAKKFTTRGCIRVGAKVSSDGEWIECYVADTGMGISAEVLDHVFDRFFKANEFVPGTGLGLPICQAIMELLGGDIQVFSEVNKGTTICFRIPYRKP